MNSQFTWFGAVVIAGWIATVWWTLNLRPATTSTAALKWAALVLLVGFGLVMLWNVLAASGRSR